ncbi:unnamed protein product [Laminaria digitata]
MDLATIVGLVAAFAIVFLAMVVGATPDTYVNVPGILIVVGGTLAANMIKFPMRAYLASFPLAVRTALFDHNESRWDLVITAGRLARHARKKDFAALENEPVRNPYFQRAIEMFVDGRAQEFAVSYLDHEMERAVERLELSEKVFRRIGDSAPAFGLIGTLVGLVQMLSQLDDISTLGPAMAVALLTTLYGAMIANLVAVPLADKIRERANREQRNRQIIKDSVLLLYQRQDPQLVNEILSTYLTPVEQERLFDEDA